MPPRRCNVSLRLLLECLSIIRFSYKPRSPAILNTKQRQLPLILLLMPMSPLEQIVLYVVRVMLAYHTLVFRRRRATSSQTRYFNVLLVMANKHSNYGNAEAT